MKHTAFVLATLSPLLFSGPVTPKSLPIQVCSGCEGNGWMSTDSIPGCGSVAISVLVAPGECMWVTNPDSNLIDCTVSRRCLATITRSWNGVPAGTELALCITRNGQTRCIAPAPNSGPGTGSHTTSWALTCGDGYTWSISLPCQTAGIGLHASANGSCEECL